MGELNWKSPLGLMYSLSRCNLILVTTKHTKVNIFALKSPPRGNRLRPLGSAESRALDFVDRGRAATGHHGDLPLRATGLDESQKTATPQAAGNGPAAIHERICAN